MQTGPCNPKPGVQGGLHDSWSGLTCYVSCCHFLSSTCEDVISFSPHDKPGTGFRVCLLLLLECYHGEVEIKSALVAMVIQKMDPTPGKYTLLSLSLVSKEMVV